MNTKRYYIDDLKNKVSQYLMGGYKEDEIKYGYIDIGPDSITAKITIPNFYLPTDEKFHLSSITADCIVQQILIIFSCVSNNVDKKNEVYLRNIEWDFRSPIDTNENILVSFSNIKSKKIKNVILYKAEGEINGGCFKMRGSWVFKP